MIWLRHILLLLIIPSYLIALSHRRWATLPLWLVSTSVMLAQYAMAAQQGAAFGSGAADESLMFVCEMTKIMLIPIAVQFAVALRSRKLVARKASSSRLQGALIESL